MIVRTEARARLARLRDRQRLAEQAAALPPRRAQALDLTWHDTDDIKGRLTSLKAKYDLINRTSANDPGWAAHYKEFVAYFDRIMGRWTWWGFGDGTWQEILRREKELAGWQERLEKKGFDAGPKVVLEPEPLGGALEGITNLVLTGGGLYLLMKVLSAGGGR